MTINWQPLADIFERADRLVITSHCRADCDAVGSALAVREIVLALGKQAQVVLGDAVPEHIRFLDPHNDVAELDHDVEASELLEADALVVVDTSAWSQLGPMADVVREFTGPKVVVDHHVSEDDFGATVFKDSQAEATGRLVLQLAESLDVQLTPRIATLLFTAIATDTGWFRFSSVTGETFAALAKLVAAGASPPVVFSELYERHTLARVHLRGRIFTAAESYVRGRLLTASVTLADFNETGAAQNDTEDAINVLLTVAGSEVAVLFVELSKQQTKVSLRSRTDFDVAAIAGEFGGGGHKAAAGVTIDEPLATTQAAVLNRLRDALQ